MGSRGDLRVGKKSKSVDFKCIFFFFWPYRTACGILVPQPGIEPVSPALEGGVSTTGPPGRSPLSYFEGRGLCDSLEGEAER